MTRLRTDNELSHACPSCDYPCDCGEDRADCRECYYCNEERFDRQIRESEDDTDESEES